MEDNEKKPTLWDKAAEVVLERERKKRNDPNWKPTLLNGGLQFEKNVHALMQEWVDNGIEELVK